MSSVVRFEPRGAVLELFRSDHREVCLSGAAGSGKTVGALMYVHLMCLNNPGVRALIVRKTHTSLTASTLVTFREKVAAEALAERAVHFYGGSAQEPAAYRYDNGSVIVVGGLDKSSRILSTEYDLVFVDEATETTEEDLDTIVTRLRHGTTRRQRLICATNPGAPTHHLKTRCGMGRMTMLYSTHEDNPRMYSGGAWTPYGQDYLDRLESLTGVRYERMRWGRWAAAEGLVYEDFNPGVHLLDRFDVPADWPLYVVVDFGFTNPFVAQFWRVDPDGRLYLEREIYRTRRLVEDHAKDILGILDGRKPVAVICDHDAEDRATLERHTGFVTTPARKAVTPGIQAKQSRLRPAGDGKPRLYVLRDAVLHRDPALVEARKPASTEEEFPGYVWLVKPGGEVKEQPVKEDDHGMDGGRYMVTHLDLRDRMTVQSPVGKRLTR